MLETVRASAVMLICGSIVFSSFGCIGPVTTTMWEYALKTKVEGASITGCIVDPDTSPQRVRALVARYMTGVTLNSGGGLDGYSYSEEHYVLVPLEPDGTPV